MNENCHLYGALCSHAKKEWPWCDKKEVIEIYQRIAAGELSEQSAVTLGRIGETICGTFE